MSDHRPTRVSAASLLAAAILLAGCASTGVSSPLPASAAPSVASAQPTAEVMPTASPPVVPATPEPSIATPPAASIAVEGGDRVVGDVGSFTWQDSGSDSPWIPGAPIRVGAGERLTLNLVEAVAIEHWTASYVPRAELHGSTPTGLGEGTGEPVAFESPPAGKWSVSVDVWFAGGLGSAAYYWSIEVE